MKNASATAKKYADTKALVGKWWSVFVDKVKRFANKPTAQNEPESPADKAARWTTFATIWIAIFTFVLAGVGYLQYCEIRDSGIESTAQTDQMLHEYRSQVAQMSRQAGETHDLARHMKDQAERTKELAAQAQNTAKILRQQLEITDRPWIMEEITISPMIAKGVGFTIGKEARLNTGWFKNNDIRQTIPLSFDAIGRADLLVKISLKNIGKLVATNVRIRHEGFQTSSRDDIFKPISEQKDLCQGANTDTINTAIFPEGTSSELVAVGFDANKVAATAGDYRLGKPMNLYVIGCIDYTYKTSNIPHQTGFIYQITARNPEQGISAGGSYDLDRLVFNPYSFGGRYGY